MQIDTIRTDRLTLRPARPEDVGPLHALFSDPEVMRYWDRPAYDDVALTERFVEHFMTADWAAREEYILELDGTCIGKAGVWAKPEVGYILAPSHWGKGYVTEALQTILPRAFARWPDLPVLTAELDPRNAPSIRLLERLGFMRTGYVEKNFLYGDTWTDTAYYQLPRPD